MKNILYIESSPRKKRSSSIEIAQFFLQHYQKQHPDSEIKTIDLWNTTLPAFDNDTIDAKYAIMHQQSQNESQRKSWHVVEEFITEFKQADKYVFSIPMWNFGIPYPLKHYFDIIVQPGYTFSHSEAGYKGLVLNKPALVVYSRGGAYGPESGAQGLDLQKSYMELILKFIGFTTIESIVIEPTMASPEQKEQVMQAAKEKAEKLAANF